MRLTPRTTPWTALLLLSIGCSWGAASGRADQKPMPEAHEILIRGFMYQPDVVTLHIGDTVQWKNSDIVPHTVSAEDKSFNSGLIAPGATWSSWRKKLGYFHTDACPIPICTGS